MQVPRAFQLKFILTYPTNIFLLYNSGLHHARKLVLIQVALLPLNIRMENVPKLEYTL